MSEEQNLTELQKNIIRFFHQNTFADHMNVEVVMEEGGSAHLELLVEEYHTNLYNIAHGGVLMTLADTAMGAACLELGKKVVTIQLGIEFMHSVPLTERIITRAKVLHDGRRTMACECEMLSREGKLFAKSHGTFYVLGQLEEE